MLDMGVACRIPIAVHQKGFTDCSYSLCQKPARDCDRACLRKVQPISKSLGCQTRLNNSAADVLESDPAEDPILLFEYDSKLLTGMIADAAFASVS